MRISRSFLRTVAGIAGLVFLVLAFIESLERAEGLTFPSPTSLLLTFLLLILAMISAGFSWAALFRPDRGRRELFGVFFQAQPGKYIPGGVWQAAMQIGFARNARIGLGMASVAFVVHSITQLVAGLALGSALSLFVGWIPTVGRAAIAAGVLSLALLRREWMDRFVQLVRGAFGLNVAGSDIPAQESILRSAAWSVATLAWSGLAFALIAQHFEIAQGGVVLVLTFSLSWALGYLAVPFPAGLGVREGVMILLLGSNAASVIAASLVHRILTMAAEVTMLAAVEARARWS